MSARTPEPCDGLGGDHAGPVHFYLTGWKCDAHSPWALRGLPKPQSGPGLPSGAWTQLSPLSTSRVTDERAIASGKRRSSPHVYKAAKAAVDQRKDQS